MFVSIRTIFHYTIQQCTINDDMAVLCVQFKNYYQRFSTFQRKSYSIKVLETRQLFYRGLVITI
jgi:hypothetical protein